MTSPLDPLYWHQLIQADQKSENQIPIRYQKGDPLFYDYLRVERDLYEAKNADYTAGLDTMGNFNRVSKILELYPGLKPSDPRVVALTYLLKQLDAVMLNYAAGHKQQVEGNHDRLQDVAIYARILRILETRRHPIITGDTIDTGTITTSEWKKE